MASIRDAEKELLKQKEAQKLYELMKAFEKARSLKADYQKALDEMNEIESKPVEEFYLPSLRDPYSSAIH